MSLTHKSYKKLRNINYRNRHFNEDVCVDGNLIIDVIVHANMYLVNLEKMFQKMNFDFYSSLGQRNLSGFIGEVFSNTFIKIVPGYCKNPHGDGRPDLIDLCHPHSHKYFHESCIAINEKKEIVPIKKFLTPYQYGGMEVKCSIGTPQDDYKEVLLQMGKLEFAINMPRINLLSSITYWGHHNGCENLIGIYYDYYNKANHVPQIVAVMHSELNSNTDWTKLSIGKKGSKKTSNTSLTKTGKSKMYSSVVAVLNDEIYLAKLEQIGLKI